jgi:hypothetical protein
MHHPGVVATPAPPFKPKDDWFCYRNVARVRHWRLVRSAPAVLFGVNRTSNEKAPINALVNRGFHKMERAKRLELSTSTLARWCSTN